MLECKDKKGQLKNKLNIHISYKNKSPWNLLFSKIRNKRVIHYNIPIST